MTTGDGTKKGTIECLNFRYSVRQTENDNKLLAYRACSITSLWSFKASRSHRLTALDLDFVDEIRDSPDEEARPPELEYRCLVPPRKLQVISILKSK